MPRYRATAGIGEEPEALIQPLRHLLGAQYSEPGGGQLQGQRDAVESAADLGDGRRIGVAQSEAGLGRPGALTEERHRVGCGQVVGACGVCGGKGQRWEREDHFAGQAERLAAGGEDRDLGAPAQQEMGETGRCLHEVLAIVDDEEKPPCQQAFAEPLLQRRRPLAGCHAQHAEGVGHFGGDQCRVTDPAEVDLPGAVGESIQVAGRQLESGPRFPAPPTPVRVSRREPASSPSSWSSSRLLPMNELSDIGRLWRRVSGERSGGKLVGRSGWSSW